MNYKVYNTDTNYWMTYRRDYDGHYSVVHEGLPSTVEFVPCYRPEKIRICRRRLSCWGCPYRRKKITNIYLYY